MKIFPKNNAARHLHCNAILILTLAAAMAGGCGGGDTSKSNAKSTTRWHSFAELSA